MKTVQEITYETTRGTELFRWNGKAIKVTVATLPVKELGEMIEALQALHGELAASGVLSPNQTQHATIAPQQPQYAPQPAYQPQPQYQAQPQPPQPQAPQGSPWGQAPRPQREDVL